MEADDNLRGQLLALIDGRGAHMPFDTAVADSPDDAIDRLPPNVPTVMVEAAGVNAGTGKGGASCAEG